MIDKYRFNLLTDAKICHRYLQAGLAIILFTFIISFGVVLILAIDETSPAINMLTMLSLFVGFSLLLFGIVIYLYIFTQTL